MDFVREHRYSKKDDGELTAEIVWQEVDESTVDVKRTFVDDSLRGQGIAEQLVDAVVAEMEERNKKIIPTCPYVESLFEKKQDKYGHIEAKN